MTIEEALDWIHGRLKFGSRPGLIRIESLLERVGNPENKIQTIHIAGTNGKGSTVTFLRAILTELGLKVGTFTSPYIEMFNERISIDGKGISDKDLVAYTEKYQKIVAEMDADDAVYGITEFELITAMAFDYFEQEKVDVAIIEVGLGGLLDSTNVISPVLTGITTIGLDHQDILGDTIEEIAAQKAGIIKVGVPVVTGNIVPEALAVIEDTAKEKNSSLFRFQKEYEVKYVHPDENWGEIFSFKNKDFSLENIKISMIGRHQTENAGMAMELASLFAKQEKLVLTKEIIEQGMKKAFWPARMERISKKPLIILDGAHNGHAMSRLVENIKSEFGNRQLQVLFSALKTKDIDNMVEMLTEVKNVHLNITSFDYPKALDLSEISYLEHDGVEFVSIWQFGIGDILEKMKGDDVLLITGSLYFVSQVREFFIEMNK